MRAELRTIAFTAEVCRRRQAVRRQTRPTRGARPAVQTRTLSVRGQPEATALPSHFANASRSARSDRSMLSWRSSGTRSPARNRTSQARRPGDARVGRSLHEQWTACGIQPPRSSPPMRPARAASGSGRSPPLRDCRLEMSCRFPAVLGFRRLVRAESAVSRTSKAAASQRVSREGRRGNSNSGPLHYQSHISSTIATGIGSWRQFNAVESGQKCQFRDQLRD
jgi:hypothetical protein